MFEKNLIYLFAPKFRRASCRVYRKFRSRLTRECRHLFGSGRDVLGNGRRIAWDYNDRGRGAVAKFSCPRVDWSREPLQAFSSHRRGGKPLQPEPIS